jgi:hypothetical protein
MLLLMFFLLSGLMAAVFRPAVTLQHGHAKA